MSRIPHDQWLIETLFVHARITRPDGRPLYAYKLTDERYSALQERLRRALADSTSLHRQSRQLPPLFCWYAAETFCREHESGPWSWQTIFAHLTRDPINPSLRSAWIEQGLAWWRRPLLRTLHGDRKLLVTLACEGGLPLKLLHRQNHALRDYFEAALQRYLAQPDRSDGEMALAICRELADRLPQQLQEEVVYALGCRVLVAIEAAQLRLGDDLSGDVIARLNTLDPEWHHALPLRLEDSVAKALLTGLVQSAEGQMSRRRAPLRWRSQLVQAGNGWQAQRQLEYSDRIAASALSEVAATKLPSAPRWRLLQRNSAEDRPLLQWMSLGRDGDPLYRCELLRQAAGLHSPATEAVPELWLTNGEGVWCAHLPGDDPWLDGPWYFAATEPHRWLGQGSLTLPTGVAEVWVALASDESCDGEPVGAITDAQRQIWRVTQAQDLSTRSGRFSLRRGSKASAESFQLFGQHLAEAVAAPPWLGLPQFRALDEAGQMIPLGGRRQWRAVGGGSGWLDDLRQAFGDIWLRQIDEHGVERVRRRISVAPAGLQIMQESIHGSHEGYYELRGLAQAKITAHHNATTIVIEGHGDRYRLRLPPLAEASVTPITIVLNWIGGQSLTLSLPYPQYHLWLSHHDRPLPASTTITLDGLSGLHLHIFAATQPCRYQLSWHLNGSRRAMSEKLPPLHAGRLDQPLVAWHDRLAVLLASSDDLDSRVTAQVRCDHESVLSWQVARYALELTPDHAARQVALTAAALERWAACPGDAPLRLEMFPLWQPTAERVVLQAQADNGQVWSIPADLPAGPWWIVATAAGLSLRPLLWTVHADGDSEAEGSPLETAIRTADAPLRQQRLDAVLSSLGEDASHADWPLVHEMLALSSEFPPSSLHTLRQLIRHPQSLIMLLLQCQDRALDQVVALEQGLPLLWPLLPHAAWQQALRRYAAQIDGLPEALQGEIMLELRQRIDARLPFFNFIFDWALPRWAPAGSVLALVRKMPSILESSLQLAEMDLQARHDESAIWPQIRIDSLFAALIPPQRRYSHLSPHLRGVRALPFLVAALAAHAAQCVPEEEAQLHYEVREAIAFDPRWFDEAFKMALALSLCHS
jgi:hypothetical protein